MLIEYRRMWRSLFVASSLLALGCGTRPNPSSCTEEDFCRDPSLPFCDTDGALSGDPGTCVAVTCAPREFERCRGREALVCSPEGNNFEVTTCEYGCDEQAGGCLPCEPGSAACEPRINPHFLPDVCDSQSLQPNFDITSMITLDTSDDASCSGGIIPQTNGVDVCVVRTPQISISAGATLRAVGTRALALVADTEVSVAGTLDVSADWTTPGPGATRKSGGYGGGAGFATEGGLGASTSTSIAGAAVADPASGSELIAGASATEVGSKAYAAAGAGGGAIVLVSCRSSVTVAGRIDASGGGGRGGATEMIGAMTVKQYGGGGGSGGYIVLQGMSVEVFGSVFANGGGGGAGVQQDNTPGASGADGALSALDSPTGGAGLNGAGAGGDGGQFERPDNGWQATATNGRGGGGGGSAGMIQMFTPTNVPPLLDGATVSPPARAHRTVETTK